MHTKYSCYLAIRLYVFLSYYKAIPYCCYCHWRNQWTLLTAGYEFFARILLYSVSNFVLVCYSLLLVKFISVFYFIVCYESLVSLIFAFFSMSFWVRLMEKNAKITAKWLLLCRILLNSISSLLIILRVIHSGSFDRACFSNYVLSLRNLMVFWP